jgi:hypothetical protein
MDMMLSSSCDGFITSTAGREYYYSARFASEIGSDRSQRDTSGTARLTLSVTGLASCSTHTPMRVPIPKPLWPVQTDRVLSAISEQ